MSIKTDHQVLEPGSKVRLFEVDGSQYGGPVLYFHGHAIPHTPEEIEKVDDPAKLPAKSIWWGGREHKPWPVQIEGLEVTSDGTAPSPTLSVGNIDGTIGSMCLVYQNLALFKVTIRTTYAHYLDARNFPDGNASADPTQEKIDVWYIDRKLTGTNTVIQFALSSPADLQGIMIPTRQIHSLCTWCIRGQYRGASCGYTGTKYFDVDGKPVSDPSKDVCSGLLSTGCEPRWGKGNPLPFGGFPGSALLKR